MSTPFRVSICIFIFIICAFLVELIRTMNADREKEIAGRQFSVELTEEQMKDKVLVNKLGKMISACPGLQKYSPDFSRAKVEENRGTYFFTENTGMQIVFTVSDSPQTMPPPLNVRSRGNTCYFSVNGSGTEMSISKSACKSLCQGKWVEYQAGEEMKLAM